MHFDTWFGKLWTRFRAGVVQDVPPGLEECEACRELECTQERWLNCEKRLETEAAQLCDAKATLMRTDELPRIFMAQEPQAAPPESGEPIAPPRRRKISSES